MEILIKISYDQRKVKKIRRPKKSRWRQKKEVIVKNKKSILIIYIDECQSKINV